MAVRFIASDGSCLGKTTRRFIHLALLSLLLCATTSTQLSTAQTTENVTEIVTEHVDEEAVTVPSTTTDDMPDEVTDLQTEQVTEIVTEHVVDEVVTVPSTTTAGIDDITDDMTDLVTDLQTEQVTEIVTEYVVDEVVTVPSTTTEGIDDITDDMTDLVTDLPGPTLVMRFTISNKNYSDLEDPAEKDALSKLLVEEFELLYAEHEKFNSVTVLEFRNGSIIVDIQLEFTDALNVRERDDVVTTLFEKVVLNGTLGALQLQDLVLVDDDGQVEDMNDACDIRPCLQPDMKCVAEGTKCTARCGNNKEYCLNDSVCQPNNDYILCKCKRDFFGYRCDKKPRPPGQMRNGNAYIGIIAAAGIAVILLLVLVVGCGYNRLINRGKESDTSKLFPAENSVALEMLDEPPPVVGGVACQTIESFLLTKYIKHGVPPKPGFQHEIIQTNDSFLLVKAQREREANYAPASNTPNGTEATPPPPPASAPTNTTTTTTTTTTTEQDGKIGQGVQSSTEPQQGVPAQGGRDEQGISNEAFVEDEGDIVPTAEVAEDAAGEEIGKKIIKV